MMRATLLAAALCASGPALAAESQQDCGAIADPAARLACYDEKHGKTAPAAAPAPPAATPPAATPEAAPAPPSSFGLPPKPDPVEEVASIKAHLVGSVKSWEKGTLFKLDNGQVWKAVGDESRYYKNIPENAEVTIGRGAFGSYWMEITAVRARIKVKRLS
jgi:hypothetical protein